MLFTETPSSPDSHKISLKEVDPSSTIDLDEDNPIPKFSIRDYVNNARSKDTKTNWPFSEKSLQLCLKHGVKDLLPPFQYFDCIKNRTRSMETERDVESSLNEKGKLPYLDGERSNMSNDHMHSSPNKVGNISNSDKQLPVTTNNPPNDHMHSSPKMLEKPDHLPKKPKVRKPSSMKKCKSKVKVGTNGTVPSSNLKTTSMMVEPMGSSKVCPVCKTFSSFSNTTLNAHIDQCLSVDSSKVWPVCKTFSSSKMLEKPDHLPKKPKVPKPPSMKKCKSKVKVGTNGAVPSSNIKTTSMMVEPMGSSKVCPVFKTFSSFSNTTLNAHIDQCLSVDSSIVCPVCKTFSSSKMLEKPDHLPKKLKVPKPPSMKKCKSKVKVGTNGAVPSSNIKTTSMMVEPMGSSKVCPVCKTLSYSSNTTLNAHIDQCLSVDSPTEPSSRLRATVIKHRRKLRKTSLMVDIYAPVLNCTLEELEQRNGRMSEKSILPPVQETMVDVGEEERQRTSIC